MKLKKAKANDILFVTKMRQSWYALFASSMQNCPHSYVSRQINTEVCSTHLDSMWNVNQTKKKGKQKLDQQI